MNCLQVKEYHERIADVKMDKAMREHKTCTNLCFCPTELMFYFYGQDRHGIPTERRQRGWVAYNGTSAVYGRNRAEAVRLFKERGGVR